MTRLLLLSSLDTRDTCSRIIMSKGNKPPPLPDHLLQEDEDDDLFVSAIEVSDTHVGTY